MSELREWVEFLLIPVLIPLYFAARKGWRQWKAKREAEGKMARRETRRADTYETEGTEAITMLERELDEVQLENEDWARKDIESREIIRSQASALQKLSDAYEILANGRAVES